MTCDEEALTEYLDGELSTERRAALESHLKVCAACAKTLERLKAGSAALKKHAALPPAVGLAESVLPSKGRGGERRGRHAAEVIVALTFGIVVMLTVGKMFKPQISGVFNQIMGMISGAASTVGSGN